MPLLCATLFESEFQNEFINCLCTLIRLVPNVVRKGTYVTFKWNILLDLSGEAATKSFGVLSAEFSLKVLSKSTWAMAIWVIRCGRGRGRYPRHTRWFRGSAGSAQ